MKHAMRPPRLFTTRQKNAVRAALREPHTTEEFKRVQAVALRSGHGMSAGEIAKILGLHEASVWKMHARFLKEGAAMFASKKRGGRYRQNLSPVQERELLAPFKKEASEGGLVSAGSIMPAYEKAAGKAAVPSTVYRLLRRHGWRKVVPRPAHPRAGAARRTAFKKTSENLSNAIWTPFPQEGACG
jgi:transposase